MPQRLIQPAHANSAPASHSVLIVDDSAFMRKLIIDMVQSVPGFTVVGVARNGVDALQQIETLHPDVVTLDLEMPQLDGMQVLQTIMATAPRPVIVLSAGGPQFGDATMHALELGAVDFVKKPSGAISLDLEVIRDRLVGALTAAVSVDTQKLQGVRKTLVNAHPPHARQDRDSAPPARCVVVIAASTGGPRALTQLIPTFPPDFPAAILIAQHMPREFTPSFAAHLDRVSALHVTEGVDGEPLRAGHVYLAPGGTHMRVAGTRAAPVIAIDVHTTPVAVSPSADVLFASAASVFGAQVVAAVLTGMGRDGTEGARAVQREGGVALVQDRETSVIYGMPQSARAVVPSDHVVPLSAIGGALSAAIFTMVSPHV